MDTCYEGGHVWGVTNCEVTLHIGHVTAWQCHIVTGHNPRYYERERRWLGNNHIWPSLSPSNSWVGRHLNLLKNKSLLNSFRWGHRGEEAELQIMSGTRLGAGSEAIFMRGRSTGVPCDSRYLPRSLFWLRNGHHYLTISRSHTAPHHWWPSVDTRVVLRIIHEAISGAEIIMWW